MRQVGQMMRFSDVELAQIKGIFSDNEDLLYAIRKHMLQFSLTPREQQIIEELTETAHALIEKFFFPELDGDSPLFQMTDLYLGLNVDLKDKTVDFAAPYIEAKDLEIEYLKEQIERLRDLSRKPKILLEEMTKRKGKKQDRAKMEKRFIGITARNYLLSYVDSNLNQIKILAGLKDETVEQTKARLQKDSNK